MLYTRGEGSFSTRVPRESHPNFQSVSKPEHLDIPYITSRLDEALDRLSGGHQIVMKPRKNEGDNPLTRQTPSPLFTTNEIQPVSCLFNRMVPVWSHESIINFNNRGGYVPDIIPQEQALLSSLDRLRGCTQDLLLITNGTLCVRGTLATSQVGLYPTPPILNKKGVIDWTQTRQIVSLPPFIGVAEDDETDLNEYGFPASVHNLLQAASNCRECGRVDISSDVYIRALDAGEFDPNEGQLPFRLQVLSQISLLTPKIFESIEGLRETFSESQRRLLTYIFRPLQPVRAPNCYSGEPNMPFFFHCLKPAPALPPAISENLLQPQGLKLTLLPFQRKSVFWMLGREGMTMGENGEVSSKGGGGDPGQAPLFWESINPAAQAIDVSSCPSPWWFQPLTGNLRSEKPPHPEFLGAMNCETMGLGKTIEVIALILLHTPAHRNMLSLIWNPNLQIWIKPVKTSLIVAPAALQQQWVEEMKGHAPSLKVLVYEGWSKLQLLQEMGGNGETEPQTSLESGSSAKISKKRKAICNECHDDVDAWYSYAQNFDVIITTYHVLQGDLNAARPPVKRPRRETAEYKDPVDRLRSPLIMLQFTRVIMDEVQQVGGGNAATMVSLIPRLSSIAVSGTPAKARVKDLVYPLRFLRVPYINQTKLWNRLLRPPFASHFKELFDLIALRTPKSIATQEFTMPKQSRFVVPIMLGAIERHLLSESLRSLGSDEGGSALKTNRVLDPGLLRGSLRKLRQACTHPQVGSLLGGIQTLGNVLEGMVKQNLKVVLDNQRTYIQERIRLARIIQLDEAEPTRFNTSLTMFLSIRDSVVENTNEIRKAINDEMARIRTAQSLAPIAPVPLSLTPLENTGQGFGCQAKDDEVGKGKGKDSDDDVDPESSADVNHGSFRFGLISRLRDAQITLHQVHFLLGDLYHTFGNVSKEAECYQAAETLRHTLLRKTEHRALLAVQKLRENDGKTGIMRMAPSRGPVTTSGKSSANLFETASGVISLLERQVRLLWAWRDQIIALLSQNLSLEEQGAEGQEYMHSLEIQNDAESYLKSWTALIADHKETLVAEKTTLAVHEDRDVKQRTTNRTVKADGGNSAFPLQPPSPGQVSLLSQLMLERRSLHHGQTHPSLKDIMAELKKIKDPINNQMLGCESIVAQCEALHLKEIMEAQCKLIASFENDSTLFRKVFNGRLLYFRQLQELSDSVADFHLPERQSFKDAQSIAVATVSQVNHNLGGSLAKQRYLDYLTAQQNQEFDEEKCCILCKSEFTTGYITACAHIFCVTCLKVWMKRRPEGMGCPMCRTPIDVALTHQIIVPPSPLKNTWEQGKQPNILRPCQVKYNTLDLDTLTQVQGMATIGEYGSKIQTLVKHLLWLKEHQHMSKSIVFSAWADSLSIVAHALDANAIQYVHINSFRAQSNPAREFCNNSIYQVLLLHGERDSTGLNLTVAKQVFLLEPVVNHAFEVQAISRIDRLGQDSETEVYCYYADDTVEKSILDLAYHHGQSLYVPGKANPYCHGTIQPKAEDLSGDVKQKGDFVAKTDDILAILFPHLFFPLENGNPRVGRETVNAEQAVMVGPSCS